MRNLKRALSLTMASVMMMGMMVTGAGAAGIGDFSDKDKIVNTEAVSVLNTLGVIAGRDDGSYDPTGVVTRGEMAKMICIVLNGGKNPQLGNISANFADTKGHWAEAYIAYCANLGIIAGKGNGNFEPNATVTGSEAAKMLLVALGYNASVEGYTGANWQINVDVAANQKDLYDSLGALNTTDGLTRDNAAQMVYNALDCQMVEYNYIITGTPDNSLTTKPQVTNGKLGTLMKEKFGAIKVEGIVVGNEFADLSSSKQNDDKVVIGAALDDDKTKIVITNDDDQKDFSGTQIFSLETNVDMLGRSVSIYVKPSSTASKSTVIGSAIPSADNKVVTDYTSDKIADVADDNNLDIVSGTQVALNYAQLGKLSDYTGAATAGEEKILIDNNNDGDVDYVLLNTYIFGKVTAYSTKDDGSITVKADNGTTLTVTNKKNVVGFEDVAKNDYVLASFMGGKLHVEKPEHEVGTLEAYKTNTSAKNTSMTVDGSAYSVSHVTSYTSAADGITAAKDYESSTYLDADATFYLDRQGRVIAVGDVIETTYAYAYVQASVNSANNLDKDRVKVTLQDGTSKTYNVATKNSLQVNTTDEDTFAKANDEIVLGAVYAYTFNSDGEIRLTAPVAPATIDQTTATDATFAKGKTTVAGTGLTTSYANNNTVFFYDNGTDVSVYTGYTNAPTVATADNAKATVAMNKSGKTVAVAFQATSFTSADVSNHMFLYKTGDIHTDYTMVSAYLNGSDEAVEIKVNTNDSVTLTADKLYTYTTNTKGEYVLSNVPGANTVNPGAVATHISGTTVVTGGVEYKVTSKTLLVDNTDNPSKPAASLGNVPASDDKITSILFNNDKEILLIVVDNTKAVTPPTVGGYEANVTAKGNDMEVRFYSVAPTVREMAAMIKATDKDIESVAISGTDATVKYNDGSSVVYTVKMVEMFKVTVENASYEIDGITFGVSVKNAYVADATKAVVTVSVKAGTAAAGSVDATVTASNGETVDNGTAVTAATNVTLGTDKLTTTAAGAVTAGSYTFDVTVDGADIQISIA